MPRARRLALLALPFVIAAAAFLTGIHWGLPSRDVDRYLFGDRTPWTGAEILARTGGWGSDGDATTRASDHDANPLTGRDEIQVVNGTDEQRAEIVLRYRLYSQQPDEMLTPRALAQMRPGRLKFDPKMYQYGGLWVYPVGGLLKVLSDFNVVTLRGDVAFYLDHPEKFGKFYVVMRAYSAAWGLAGVAAAMLIVRRLTRACVAATVAGGVVFALLPVVVSMAHEAKPHLAGMVLLLWTILAADVYARAGGARRAIIAGACWGAATGMVLLSVPGVVVLPVMVLLRRAPRARQARDLAFALAAGAIVYAVTNPYVLLNAFDGNAATVSSNMMAHGNFYGVGDVWDGLANGLDLLAEGGTLVVMLAGAVVATTFGWRLARRSTPTDRDSLTLPLLLAVPAVAVLLQFVLLGAHKPGEYARFALLPCAALAIAAVTGARLLTERRATRVSAILALCVATFIGGGAYVLNFARGAGVFGYQDTRAAAAHTLSHLKDQGRYTLAIPAEPAPYSMPPIDLFRWRILLLPKGAPDATAARDARVDVYVAVTDRTTNPPTGLVSWSPIPSNQPWPTPISWANKPIDLFVPHERGVRDGWER